MRPHMCIVIGSIICIAIAMVLILGLHVGGEDVLRFGIYAPLFGAFAGGCLVLVSINIPIKPQENVEPWARYEKVSWTLIGCGCLAWGIGECFWRYYVAYGEIPFPSPADIGYASFLPLVFSGLLLQKYTKDNTHTHAFLLLDSLIATGALLSIAWYLLLGSLAQSPEQSLLAKVLVLYYPTADIALLSCTIFLLLREHTSNSHLKARRAGLFLIGAGLTIYAGSDFAFNVLQNIQLPTSASWMDTGWPLGMMTIGLAAYMRRFLPGKATANVRDEQPALYVKPLHFNFSQSLPYLLLLILFSVLTINVLSDALLQKHIRLVLVIATFVVVIMVVIRQIITTRDNRRLMQEQSATLIKLEQVYQDIEKRQFTLEVGIAHLKEVQTRLANGDVRARAQILNGDLWPLASGLNIMADRMMRSEQRQKHAQNLLKAISDLNLALEHQDERVPFAMPASCLSAPLELTHLLRMIGLKPELRTQATPQLTPPPAPHHLSTPGRKQTQPHRVTLRARTDDEKILSD